MMPRFIIHFTGGVKVPIDAPSADAARREGERLAKIKDGLGFIAKIKVRKGAA